MSVIKGLKNINAYIEAEEAKHSGESTKAKWFSLKDKEAAKLVFLQELDESSPTYSSKNGVGVIAVEHSNPDDFKRKALCSMDDDNPEARCWACERHRASYRELGDEYKGGWKKRSRLYINVLVDNGVDEPYVAVLSQGLSAKQITPALLEHAVEIGSISDKHFKVKRQGAGFNDTQYILTPLGLHGVDVEEYDLFNLDDITRKIPFEQQEAHYMSGAPVEAAAPAAAPKPVVDTSDEW